MLLDELADLHLKLKNALAEYGHDALFRMVHKIEWMACWNVLGWVHMILLLRVQKRLRCIDQLLLPRADDIVGKLRHRIVHRSPQLQHTVLTAQHILRPLILDIGKQEEARVDRDLDLKRNNIELRFEFVHEEADVLGHVLLVEIAVAIIRGRLLLKLRQLIDVFEILHI